MNARFWLAGGLIAMLASGSWRAMPAVDAASWAKGAYEQILAAAAAINVQIEPQAWQADYREKGVSPMFVDTIYDGRLAR